MAQNSFDDGECIDVEVKCDRCGRATWDPWDDAGPMLWHLNEDGPDYCPSCATELGKQPGRNFS